MSSTDLSGLRERIRDLREGLGWSQRELGRRAGVSHVTICQIESGSLDPRVETLDRIATALGAAGQYVITVRSGLTAVIL